MSFECDRSIDKSIDSYFFLLSWKSSMVTKSSVMELQNLVVNPKSRHVKLNSKQYQFLFKYVSSKNRYKK